MVGSRLQVRHTPCNTRSPLPPAVDWLAVTEESMSGMTAAAEAFCGALQQRFPGSRVAASSLGRLPAV